MLKYIFAAVFIALAWALVLVFHDTIPMWPAILVTVVIVVALIALAIYRVLAAKSAATKIEKGLRDQAAQHSEGIRPDMAAEIAAMESEFQKGVAALKSSAAGRSGRDALGVLPWYVMIGPSASGKTTAIRSSGLKMPAGKAGKVRGVGGTRNCDWWMTNEAILLDTAGRWSTDDDDREEWLAFLDLLKKTRPKKPINGILLAISATDLQGNEEQIGELATTLRERIDEVIARLELVVPVYLIITKCDLISGFVESFGELKDRERGQILGFSLPLIRQHDDHVDAFAQHFDDLTEVLERNALLRMGQERRIEARELDLRLPAGVRFAAPGAGRPGGEPVRQERVPGRADHARRLLHQRHARGTAGRPRDGQHGGRVRRHPARQRRAADQAEELLRARRLPARGLPGQGRGRAQRGAAAKRARGPLGDRGRGAGDLVVAAVSADLVVFREPAAGHRVEELRREAVPGARRCAAACSRPRRWSRRSRRPRGWRTSWPAAPTWRCASASTPASD